MPGTNLTRDEAATRAALLDVTSYAIDLDLTTGDDDLRLDHHDPVHLHASPAPRPSPTWSARPSTRSRSTARSLDPATAYADSRIALTGLAADNELRRRRRLHLHPHRRGPAPLRRPGRRPGLPLLAVRGPGRPPRLHHLRAARPQGAVHVHRDRARRTGRSSPTPRRPSPRPRDGGTVGVALRADQADVDLHHRARRRRVPRGPRHLPRQARRDPARPLLPPVAGRAPRRRRAGQGHQAGLRVLRGRLRLPRTRSASTTSSTCRSTTWARWRTPAA